MSDWRCCSSTIEVLLQQRLI